MVSDPLRGDKDIVMTAVKDNASKGLRGTIDNIPFL